MKETINLEFLSTRAGFNSAVRHMNKAIEISSGLGSGVNLGDLLYERGDEDLSGERGAFLLRMFLVDKLGYKTVSANLSAAVKNPSSLAQEFEKWKAVDLIAAYRHPDLGLIIANPKIASELDDFGMLRKHELLVIYAGKGNEGADDSCVKAAEIAIELFEGRKPSIPHELLSGNFTAKEISREIEDETDLEKDGISGLSSGGAAKMTPMYSVAVSNELFHNGNVEAWKRIIASYRAKYSGLQVYIYYEGERILDLNSLFQWGKVKHGSSIQFAVAGNEIKDVAKLQRYLFQGASHHFEPFLHGQVGEVLRLFG